MNDARVWEWVAALFGIVSVYLNTRQNPWGWSTGLVNVALYAVLYYQGTLYALAGLQVFYAAISIYGWYQWVRGGEDRTGLVVTRARPLLNLGLGVAAVLGSAGLGWYLDWFTPDQQPYFDAGLTVFGLVGQWMMARKYLESWLIWVAVNLVSVPLFVVRGELPTALQYAVFLGLAVSGLRQWHRSLSASS